MMPFASAECRQIARWILQSFRFDAPDQRHEAETQLLASLDHPSSGMCIFALLQGADSAQKVEEMLRENIGISCETFQFYLLEALSRSLRQCWHQYAPDMLDLILNGLGRMVLSSDAYFASRLTQRKVALILSFVYALKPPNHLIEFIQKITVSSERLLIISTEFVKVLLEVHLNLTSDILSGSVVISIKQKKTHLSVLDGKFHCIAEFLFKVSSFMEAQPTVDSFCIEALVDCMSAVATCFPADKLINAGLDQPVRKMVSSGACLTSTLQFYQALMESLGHKAQKSLPLRNVIPMKLASFLNHLTDIGSKFSGLALITVEDLQMHLRVADLMKLVSEIALNPVIQDLPEALYENHWRLIVIPLVSHPCLDVATVGVQISGLWLPHLPRLQFYTRQPQACLLEYLGLIFCQLLRQGDPACQPYFDLLTSHWRSQQAVPNLTVSEWPLDGYQMQLMSLIRPQSTTAPLRYQEVYRINGLAASLEDDLDVEKSDRNGWGETGDFRAFSHRHSLLKLGVKHALGFFKTRSTASNQRTKPSALGEAQNQSQVIWEILITLLDFNLSNVLVTQHPFFDPLKIILPTVGTLRNLPERIKPLLSPTYSVLNATFSLLGLFFECLLDTSPAAVDDETQPHPPDPSRCTQLSYEQSVVHRILQAVLSVRFQPDYVTHHYEIRRLEFLATSVGVACKKTPQPLGSILDFIFNRLNLGSDNELVTPDEIMDDTESSLTPLFLSGTVENWADQAYVIRRQSLYTLIALCETCGPSITPHLEVMFRELQKRFLSAKIHDCERLLLVETLTAVAAATHDINVQVRFARELYDQIVAPFFDETFQMRLQDPVGFVEFLYGPDKQGLDSSAEKFSNHRRALARILRLAEAVLKRAEKMVPKDPAKRKQGGYWIDSFPPVTATQRAQYGDDLVHGKNVAPFPLCLKHPFDEFASCLLGNCLAVTQALQCIWSSQVPKSHPHRAAAFCMGEEEWKDLLGNTTFVFPNVTILEADEIVFPIPPDADKSSVRLARRHLYYLRSLTYRLMGRLTSVLKAFFTYPCIHSHLRLLGDTLVCQGPLSHLISQVQLFWKPLCSDSNLQELHQNGYPFEAFLKATYVGFARSCRDRILKETTHFRVEADSLQREASLPQTEADRRWTLLSIKSRLIVKFIDALNTLHFDLLHYKGNIAQRSEPALQQARPQHYKAVIYNDFELMHFLLGLSAELCYIPHPQSITVAQRNLSFYAKFVTKAFETRPESAPRLLLEIFRLSFALASTAYDFDLTSAESSSTDPLAGPEVSPLRTFLNGQDENQFTAILAATAHKALFGLLKIQMASGPSNKEEMNIVLPELKQAVECLNHFCTGICPADAEAIQSDFLKSPGEETTKAMFSLIKQILRARTHPLSSSGRPVETFSCSLFSKPQLNPSALDESLADLGIANLLT